MHSIQACLQWVSDFVYMLALLRQLLVISWVFLIYVLNTQLFHLDAGVSLNKYLKRIFVQHHKAEP